MQRILAVVCCLAFVGFANAQLFVGVDDPQIFTYNVNPEDAGAVPLWSGYEIWGAAADTATQTIYFNDGSTLYSSSVAGPPTLLGTITYEGLSSSMVGLTYAEGKLYGTKNIATEAVYEIDIMTGVAQIALLYDAGSYDFGGLAYNSLDGLFYGVSDDSTPGRGLYSIDVFDTGSINLIAPYPGDETDIDGLTIGDNVAYLVNDEPGFFYSYDLSQGVGGVYGSFRNPWTSSEIFSGAAWIPEPASLCLLMLGGLALVRRR